MNRIAKGSLGVVLAVIGMGCATTDSSRTDTTHDDASVSVDRKDQGDRTEHTVKVTTPHTEKVVKTEKTDTADATTVKTNKVEHVETSHPDVAVDNTKQNARDRDRDMAEPTADQSKNNKSDVSIAAEIRRAVMAEKSLSMYAHNVKIIVQNGTVTLRGPVRSDAEKATIEEKAVASVGKANVTNDIEVKP